MMKTLAEDPRAKTIDAMLKRVPERWETVDTDSLSRSETEVLGLLVDAGAVDIRKAFHLLNSRHEHPLTVALEWSGCEGFNQAFRKSLPFMCEAFGETREAYLESDTIDTSLIEIREDREAQWRIGASGEWFRNNLAQAGFPRQCALSVVLGQPLEGMPPVAFPGSGERLAVGWNTPEPKEQDSEQIELLRALMAKVDGLTQTPKQQADPTWTKLQIDIWETLEGRIMTVEDLAGELCDGNSNQLYRHGDLKTLKTSGHIKNDRKKGGYYRPDAPPPELTL